MSASTGDRGGGAAVDVDVDVVLAVVSVRIVDNAHCERNARLIVNASPFVVMVVVVGGGGCVCGVGGNGWRGEREVDEQSGARFRVVAGVCVGHAIELHLTDSVVVVVVVVVVDDAVALQTDGGVLADVNARPLWHVR